LEAVVKTGAGDKLRVLVVENEPIAREILGDLLKMAGYEVLSAPTGERALWTLVHERGRIDCLFTALELPGLVDGWMLADEFRVLDAERPVVFAARTKPGKVRRPQGAAFVAHPVLPPKAVEAVNKVTGRTTAGPKSRRPPRVVVEAPAPLPIETPAVAVAGALLKAAG
jgi:CheY-like chemotaxis protein